MNTVEKGSMKLGRRLIDLVGPPLPTINDTMKKVLANPKAKKIVVQKLSQLTTGLLGGLGLSLNTSYTEWFQNNSEADNAVLFSRLSVEVQTAMLWAQDGLNTFRISKDLGAALILTDPYEDPEAKLPYRSQFFHLPKSVLAVPNSHQWITCFQLSSIIAGGSDGEEERILFTATEEVDGSWQGRVQTYWAANAPGLPVVKGDFKGSAIKEVLEKKMPEDFRSLYKRFIYNFLSWLDHAGEGDKQRVPIPRKRRKEASMAYCLDSGKERPHLKRAQGSSSGVL